MLNGRVQSFSWIVLPLLSIGCLFTAAALSIAGLAPITAGQVVQLGAYFGLITGGIVQVLMVMPIASKGLESMRSIADVLAEPDVEENESKRRRARGARRASRSTTSTLAYPDAAPRHSTTS